MNIDDYDMTNNSLTIPKRSLYNNNIDIPLPLNYTQFHRIFVKENIKNDRVLDPFPEQKEEAFNLEKELFECLNLQWGIDIIAKDVPLILNEKSYYMHLVRTAKPDPNKNNFLFIHGFISSNLHFLGILPYIIKRYNVFIPDTIGMGLSSRPQIKFTSPTQCEDYFIGIYQLFIKSLFFEGRFNIKEEYYLCGHSLGGFISSRYMLRFPLGIKKVLLLSPAGITDYNIPGTNFFQDNTCCFYCSAVCFPTFVWPCRFRVQSFYNCFICHDCIKNNYGAMEIKFDESEIKKNKDGSKFIVNYEKISTIIKLLFIISLDYPKDLSKCIYYFFKTPPPAAFFPIEKNIMNYNKIPIIFAFGEKDWMDRVGAYRLSKFDPKKYKIFTVSKSGHSFTYENPKELCSIIAQYFEEE